MSFDLTIFNERDILIDTFFLLPGETLRSRRQQDLPLPEWQDRIIISATQKPSKNSLDDVVPKSAQEGYFRSECKWDVSRIRLRWSEHSSKG